MKKIAYSIIIVIATVAFFSGCRSDNPSGETIFPPPTGEMTSFDKWLKENYVDPYNVQVMYRLDDILTDFTYNVIPADITKSKQLALLMKHLWIEAYEEVAEDGIHFVRATLPKLLHFVGSPEYNNEGTIRLGYAEGGMKVTITDVNSLDPYNIIHQYYFKTIHHEFSHILHQTIDFPVELNEISASDYAPTTWFNRKTESSYLPLGFITAYAGAQPREDFAEIFSTYITVPHEEWDRLLSVAAVDADGNPADGAAKINQKLNIIKAYLQESWKIDMDKLYEVVQRRAAEIQDMDLYNLDF